MASDTVFCVTAASNVLGCAPHPPAHVTETTSSFCKHILLVDDHVDLRFVGLDGSAILVSPSWK